LCRNLKASRRSGNLGLDGIDNARIGQGAEIAQLIALSGSDLAHDASHDLARPGLGEIRNEDDLPWSSEGSDYLPDLEDELLGKGGFIVVVVGKFTRYKVLISSKNSGNTRKEHPRFEGNKGEDSLTGEVISDTDHSSLGDTLVEDQGGLNLSSGETVTRDVDDV